jgi:hypothetical protein
MDFVKDLILSAGKTIVLIGALVSLLLTIGYLFFPNLLKSISRPVNQLFTVDEWLYVNRILVGAIFAIVTLVLFGVLVLVR